MNEKDRGGKRINMTMEKIRRREKEEKDKEKKKNKKHERMLLSFTPLRKTSDQLQEEGSLRGQI